MFYTNWKPARKVVQVSDRPGEKFWHNAAVEYLNTYDDAVTIVQLDSNNNHSVSIVASDFNFDIPDIALVNGIEVKIIRAGSVNDTLKENNVSYTIRDFGNFINNEYIYPPLDKNNGEFSLNSNKAFKLEYWDDLKAPTKDGTEYDDYSNYEMIILGGSGFTWGLPDDKLTADIINSSDLLFSTKAGLYCTGPTNGEHVKVGITRIELRVEYFFPEDGFLHADISGTGVLRPDAVFMKAGTYTGREMLGKVTSSNFSCGGIGTYKGQISGVGAASLSPPTTSASRVPFNGAGIPEVTTQPASLSSSGVYSYYHTGTADLNLFNIELFARSLHNPEYSYAKPFTINATGGFDPKAGYRKITLLSAIGTSNPEYGYMKPFSVGATGKYNMQVGWSAAATVYATGTSNPEYGYKKPIEVSASGTVT